MERDIGKTFLFQPRFSSYVIKIWPLLEWREKRVRGLQVVDFLVCLIKIGLCTLMTVAYLHIEGKGFDIAVSITRIDAET